MAFRTFDDLARGRNNNFNLIRMMAACAVVVSHSYALAGPPWVEPFSRFRFTLGNCAVVVFFALSGFLISGSFDRRPSLLGYGMARALRILPALVPVSVLTAFLVGPLFTSLPLSAYLGDRHTYEYVPEVLSLRWATANLPGLFDRLPYPVANGPLWTLYYETLCYGCLALAGVLGLLSRSRFPGAMALFAAAGAAVARFYPEAGWLFVPFALGMAVYRYREKMPAHFALALALGALAVAATWLDVLAHAARLLALSYGSLWAAQAKIPGLLHYNRIGDYSYGVYIYGWPIQQMLLSLYPGIQPLALMAAALPAATLCGAISWFVIERPALRQKERATRWAVRIVSRWSPFARRSGPPPSGTRPADAKAGK